MREVEVDHSRKIKVMGRVIRKDCLFIHCPLKKYEERGADPTGAGWYGAKRGTRKHKGLDLVALPGAAVLSPVYGS